MAAVVSEPPLVWSVSVLIRSLTGGLVLVFIFRDRETAGKLKTDHNHSQLGLERKLKIFAKLKISTKVRKKT